MFARLASFLHTNGRRVLVVAVAGAVLSGVLGSGVAKRLSPYGANDPSTQSVQATNRFQLVTGLGLGLAIDYSLFLAARLHQGARGRHRAGGADRCLDHPSSARALADGAARVDQLVGARAAAPALAGRLRETAPDAVRA